ncbi:MAG: hypothetical protein IKA19_06760 [Muribaculaceae bacterium]|nr:hypothetical protein [Muribaculaceae bacterium]
MQRYLTHIVLCEGIMHHNAILELGDAGECLISVYDGEIASTEFVSGIIIVCSSAVLEGHISNIAFVAESVNEIGPRAEKIHNYLYDAGLYSKESMTSVLAVESAGKSVKIRELHRL